MRFGNLAAVQIMNIYTVKLMILPWNRSFTSTEVSNLFNLHEGCLDETAFNTVQMQIWMMGHVFLLLGAV